jgi:fructose-1,6-bisphosphatase I
MPEQIGESLRGHLLGVSGNQATQPTVARILMTLATTATSISVEVNRAGLVGILGRTESHNVHGEAQQKLDVYANDLLVDDLRRSGCVCGLASEEAEDIIAPSAAGEKSEYLIYFDPLDGSSNIDVNVSIGTIFAIYKRRSRTGSPATLEDFLQKGRRQVAAGYFLYGTSTMLVFSASDGVNGFTLEPSTGEFRLSHPQIRTPDRGKIYSCNEGNSMTWDAATRSYVESLKGGRAIRTYTSRYVGSFVADFHRNLIKGGIFLYPADAREPIPAGKLRLMYECNPMAFLQEQAGGRAVDVEADVLDIEPSGIHHRVPLVIGSRLDVEDYLENRRQHRAA